MKNSRLAGKTARGDKSRHIWRFTRSGGVEQVVFQDGQDIARLRELDLTLWMALAMPVKGNSFDPRTAAILDSDDDGRIRPEEVLGAVDWAAMAFRDLGDLLQPGDTVALSSIKDEGLLAAARLLLANPGIDRARVEEFFAQADAWLAWNGRGKDPAVAPFGPEASAAAISAFVRHAVKPAFGDGTASLGEQAWVELCSRFSAYASWLADEPKTPASRFGAARLAELSAGGFHGRIGELVVRDASLSAETANIALVEKLVRFRRDLYRLLTNYVNFSAFYGGYGAVFQAGTLYLEARASSLCVEVLDEGKHATLASLSGAFLAYCELSRPGGARRKIVAAITDGDSDNLMVGRNGVFYDHDGLEWDATVVKLVSNPISVREAFWLPYKKLARMIEEQIAKRAQAGDSSVTAKLSETAGAVSNADRLPAAPRAETPAKKLDLGTIALIGTAIGGISALVAGFLQTIFGLGVFMPLGVLGILMLISGPSVILASLKLRNNDRRPSSRHEAGGQRTFFDPAYRLSGSSRYTYCVALFLP